MAEEKKKKKMIHKMRHKSRLVVMNDDTFEEQFSMVLSPLNVFAWGGAFLLVFAVVLIMLIALSPLREFIPGYADINTRKMATYAAIRADSVEQAMNEQQVYLENLQMILEGRVSDSSVADGDVTKPDLNNISFERSKEDSAMRVLVEEEERFNLNYKESKEQAEGKSTLETYLFYPPVKGLVTSHFNPSIKHFGVDVVPTDENATVSAALEGIIIQSAWTTDEGHVLFIQHKGDLVTVYKHNSVLLKKIGDPVKAGEAIAIVGNSGELSSGPHLHFEIWQKGKPMNPEHYLVF